MHNSEHIPAIPNIFNFLNNRDIALIYSVTIREQKQSTVCYLRLFSVLMYAGLHNDCPPATNNMLILHKNFLKLNMKASTNTENLCLKE